MSSHSCIICLSPIYRVIADYVHDYVCLNMTCINFKASVPECNTIRNISLRLEESVQSDYPIHPLLDECPIPTANQFCIFQPSPEQAIQQESSAVPQSALASGANRAEPPKARRPRKRAPAVKKEDLPTLRQPLSELPYNEGSEPLTEVTNYANRSVEERRLEAEFDGKVKRPLNPFFLYRKAYKGAAKEPKSNAASCIIAQSWAMESERVREHFADLASAERMLHTQAFPDYVYEPRRAT